MIIDKPWGWYKDLKRTPNIVVKEIYIKPFSKFSLQKHFNREECWYVVSGYGKLILGSRSYTVGPGDSHIVEKEVVHRLEAYADGLIFIEVQRGDCTEDDIVRLDDDYGRS